MTENWSFPSELQPDPAQLRFDLAAALDAVVLLRAEIPEDAFTASILGTERLGNGVVITPDGLVLTIGYLITEAQSIWLTNNRGESVAGYPLAYDQATGFGLVQPLGRLNAPMLARGSSTHCTPGDSLIMIGHGGRAHSLTTQLVQKREFAGYWEYVLDEALFTVPAHPQWGGAALVSLEGRLVGIGSLLVQEIPEGEKMQGNMIVPIDLLEPILNDMMSIGRARRAPRPWLGMYTSEADGRLAVIGLAKNGPADRAGVKQGDVIIELAGTRVSELADFFRRVWQRGSAGVKVPLTLARGANLLRVQIETIDRNDFLKKPQMH